MQWILDQGWVPVTSGINRFSDPNRPDEVAIDESANGSIDQYFSVYFTEVPAGTFSLLQADNAGRNMYGAVVIPQIIPEPASVLLLGLLSSNLLLRRRR